MTIFINLEPDTYLKTSDLGNAVWVLSYRDAISKARQQSMVFEDNWQFVVMAIDTATTYYHKPETLVSHGFIWACNRTGRAV